MLAVILVLFPRDHSGRWLPRSARWPESGLPLVGGEATIARHWSRTSPRRFSAAPAGLTCPPDRYRRGPRPGGKHRLRRLSPAASITRRGPLLAPPVHQPRRPPGVLQRHRPARGSLAALLIVAFGGDTPARSPAAVCDRRLRLVHSISYRGMVMRWVRSSGGRGVARMGRGGNGDRCDGHLHRALHPHHHQVRGRRLHRRAAHPLTGRLFPRHRAALQPGSQGAGDRAEQRVQTHQAHRGRSRPGHEPGGDARTSNTPARSRRMHAPSTSRWIPAETATFEERWTN